LKKSFQIEAHFPKNPKNKYRFSPQKRASKVADTLQPFDFAQGGEPVEPFRV